LLISHDPNASAKLTSRADLDREVCRLLEAAKPFLRDRSVPTDRRARVDLCGEWLFAESGGPEQSDAGYRPVNVPHYHDFDRGCYRRRVEAPIVGDGLIWLCFEAVDYEAEIWIDGAPIGRHAGYFAAFRFDITQRAKKRGPHQLDVSVRRAADRTAGWEHIMYAVNAGDAHGKGMGSVVDGRHMAGAGLLGRVWIEITPETYLADVYVQGDPISKTAHVEAKVAGADGATSLRARVLPRNVDAGEGHDETRLDLQEPRQAHLAVPAPGAQEWTPDAPALYWLVLELLDHGEIVDAQVVSFGFRSVEWAADGGVLLNGRPFFLRGTASLGDLWSAGWAGDEPKVIDGLLRMKALFANVVRIHVHAPARLVYECADRVGLCLYQDAPLQWHCFAPAPDLEAGLGQVAEMARRLSSHPSVIVHSICNEMHMHTPFHAADRVYLERAHQRICSIPHSFLVVQDHNGPDRPALPVTSFHEYPGYFDRTVRWASLSDELPTDRRAIMSEYGGGSFTSWPAMRETARAHGEADALPAAPDGPWTVEQMPDHRLGVMLRKAQRVVGRHRSWRGYHEATQIQQAATLAFRTGFYRRHRRRIAGAIQQFFQNPTAHLYNPWVDLALIDHLGEPSRGYYALREAFRPLALDLVCGARRGSPGQRLLFAFWLYNDYAHPVTNGVIHWSWVELSDAGAVHDEGATTFDAIEGDASVLLETREVTVPEVAPGMTLALQAQLRLEGATWCSRLHHVEVAAAPRPYSGDVYFLGDAVEAQRKLSGYGCRVAPFSPGAAPTAPVIVAPGIPLSEEERKTLRDFASSEGRVILLERPPGEDLAWIRHDQPWRVVTTPMICDLAQPEASLVDEGLDLAALTDWSTNDGRVVEWPLLAANSRKSPRWAACGDSLQYSAIHEVPMDHGSMVVCQMVVWRALGVEPSAWRLLRYMLSRPARTGMP
jgi:beta-mannosidase